MLRKIKEELVTKTKLVIETKPTVKVAKAIFGLIDVTPKAENKIKEKIKFLKEINKTPPQKISVLGRKNMTASNLTKKKTANKSVSLTKGNLHGKPKKRVLRTSIRAIKKEENSFSSNKRVWLQTSKNKTTNSALPGNKASSVKLIKNTSIQQKKVKVTKR